MSYIPMEEYSRRWIFGHKDLPVDPDDLAQIKPMTPSRSLQLWKGQISQHSQDHSFFQKDDWAGNNKSWLEQGTWQSEWDRQGNELPELLEQHFQWENNTVIYFCYDADNVVETTWEVFKRCWKNFLFYDDGPILIGRKRKQVAQFFDNGQFRVGQRP